MTDWSRFARASTAKMNLVVGGAAAVGAAALHSLPVLAVGAVAYSALVAWDLVGARKNDGDQGAPRPRVRIVGPPLDPMSVSDEPTRATLRVIVAARESIDRVIAEAPPEVHEQIDASLVSLAELEERAAHLAKRNDGLARYLQTQSRRAIRGECEHLAARVETTADPETRVQLQAALTARQEHLEVVTDLKRTKERIDATLLSIASTLDGLSARIVRASGADTSAFAGDDVKEELAQMNIEIGTFEETLKTLAELEPAKAART